MSKLKEFSNFLKNVDLDSYRVKYRPIKIVEMDLPSEIQALKLIYKTYWEKKDFMSFDDFYKKYEDELNEKLENFRKKIQMCEQCFYLGLPARIYRTWASIITQIHAGYIAESVFGDGSVDMSEKLDHAGIDFLVNYNGYILNYQVKKETESREVRKEKKHKNENKGESINIFYKVPQSKIFEDPKTKKGEFRKPYLDFINNKNLERYNNGFIVFTKEQFENKKNEIDNKIN